MNPDQSAPVIIDSALNIHIPHATYQTLLGDISLWADLAFSPDPNGELLWQLSDFGQLDQQ